MIRTTHLITFTALALLAGSAYADRITVRPGESLQLAITEADAGDTIVVRGEHAGPVRLDGKTGIRIRGAGKGARIVGTSAAEPVLSLDACSDLSIERLEIAATRHGAVDIARSEGVRVLRCTLAGESYFAPGVAVRDSEAVTVSRNRFVGVHDLGVALGMTTEPARLSIVVRNRFRRNVGVGVEIHGSRNIVQRNSMKRGATSIVVNGTDPLEPNVVRRNKIRNPRGHAVHVESGPAMVDENNVRLAVLDSVLVESEGVTLTANKVKRACRNGVHVAASRTALIGNTIKASTRDGMLIVGDENVIRANVVKGSGDDAIDLEGDENVVSGNELSGDDRAIELSGDDNVGIDLP